MKNYFGTLNSADDHLLRDAISANNYDTNTNNYCCYKFYYLNCKIENI